MLERNLYIHNNDHPVSGLEINVGLIDGMDMGRWKQMVSNLIFCYIHTLHPTSQCNPPLVGCPPLHNVTEPLDFDILLNSKLLRTRILIRKEIAEAQDTLQRCSVFKEHAKTVPHQNKAPLTHNKHRVGLKHKASVAPNIEPLMISTSRKTAQMTIGRLPPHRQAITKRHRDVEKSLGEDSDKQW